MKKDENVCQSWDRRGASGAQNELPAEFCRFFPALSAAVAGIWQSHWRDDDFIFLFESSRSPTSMDVWIAKSVHPPRVQWAKFCILSKNFCLLRPSGRRICISQPTDLDIITSEREITLVEQLSPLAICCTSAHFMGVCGPEIQSISPLSRQQTCLSIHPLVCLSGYLNLMSFFTECTDDVRRSAS